MRDVIEDIAEWLDDRSASRSLRRVPTPWIRRLWVALILAVLSGIGYAMS